MCLVSQIPCSLIGISEGCRLHRIYASTYPSSYASRSVRAILLTACNLSGYHRTLRVVHRRLSAPTRSPLVPDGLTHFPVATCSANLCMHLKASHFAACTTCSGYFEPQYWCAPPDGFGLTRVLDYRMGTKLASFMKIRRFGRCGQPYGKQNCMLHALEMKQLFILGWFRVFQAVSVFGCLRCPLCARNESCRAYFTLL
jgi:hypothetical protein